MSVYYHFVKPLFFPPTVLVLSFEKHQLAVAVLYNLLTSGPFTLEDDIVSVTEQPLTLI